MRATAAEPARAAMQLLAAAGPAVECNLALIRDGGVFGARCSLADDGAVGVLARVLVCALAAQGHLRVSIVNKLS